MRRRQSEQRHGLRRLYSPLLYLTSCLRYGYVSPALGWLYRQRWLQSTLFAPFLRRMHRGLARFDLPVPDARQAALHLAANLLMPWRVKALGCATVAEFERWVSVVDARHLRDSVAPGGGVVLAGMHQGAARVVPLAVAHMGLDITILTPLSYLNKMGVDTGGRVSVIAMPENDPLWLRPALQACAYLQKGGLVGVVADGFQGAAGTEMTFLGTRRPFHAGFAELAVRTGAKVVPVSARLSADGAITIHFFPALKDAPEKPRGERTALLRSQFVARLEEEWRHAPGSVLRRHLRPQ